MNNTQTESQGGVQGDSRGASLLDMPGGRTLCVEALAGSPSLCSRLYAMGILPGTEMEICGRPRGRGGVRIRVRHSSLVLGENLARAIVCRQVSEAGRLQ